MFLSDFLPSYQFVPTGSQLPHHPLLQRLFGGPMAPGGFMGGVEFCQPIIRGESSRLIIPLVFMNFFWVLSPPTKEQYPTEKSRTSSQIRNSDVLSYLNISRPLYCSPLSYTYNLLHILVCQSIPSWWPFCYLYVPSTLAQCIIPVIDCVQLKGKDHVTVVLSFFFFFLLRGSVKHQV